MQARFRRWALALGVVFTALFALTATASASVPGIVRVDGPQTPTNTVASKTALATCPAGKQVVGVGGEIRGGLGTVTMNRLEPDPALKTVTVKADELDGDSANNWSVQAYAMCANPIPGSHLVSGARFSNGFSEAQARATCPTGEKLLGLGGEIDQETGPGTVVLTGMRLAASSLGDVRAQERPAGDSANWRVTAHGICAPPLPGQIFGRNFGAIDSVDGKSRGIGCPAGMNLLGGAGFTVGGGEVVLDDLRPSPTGFTVLGREDGDGFAGNWGLEADAICA
jgi:hypothetical protein